MTWIKRLATPDAEVSQKQRIKTDSKPINGFRNAFRLPTVLGSFPFAIVADSASLSVPLVIYGLLLRATCAVFCVEQTLYFLEMARDSERQRLFYLTMAVTLGFNYIFTVSSYTYLLLNRRLFKSIMKRCTQVDEVLFKFGVVEFDGLKSGLYIVVFLLSTTPGTVHSIQFARFESWYIIFYFYYIGISIYMSIYPIARMIDGMRIRFRSLRKILLQLSELQFDPDKRKDVVILAQVHSRLYTMCRLVNKLFNQEILFFFFIVFVNTVTRCYHVIDDLLDTFNQYSVANLTKAVVILFHCTIGYLITFLCKNASDEAVQFNKVLYQLMINDKHNEMSKDRKLRLHISLKRDILFTACGFFPVDYTLIHSMLAAATTYLVILIQFGQPAPTKGMTQSVANASVTSPPFTTLG